MTAIYSLHNWESSSRCYILDYNLNLQSMLDTFGSSWQAVTCPHTSLKPRRSSLVKRGGTWQQTAAPSPFLLISRLLKSSKLSFCLAKWSTTFQKLLNWDHGESAWESAQIVSQFEILFQISALLTSSKSIYWRFLQRHVDLKSN